MKSICLTKCLAFTALFLSLYCGSANARTEGYSVGNESCPSVEDLRSGAKPEWVITAPNGLSNNASFESANIHHSSFSHMPYVHCTYQQNGESTIIAQKNYTSTALYHGHEIWNNDFENHKYYYTCTESLTTCSWTVAIITYDSGPTIK